MTHRIMLTENAYLSIEDVGTHIKLSKEDFYGQASQTMYINYAVWPQVVRLVEGFDHFKMSKERIAQGRAWNKFETKGEQ